MKNFKKLLCLLLAVIMCLSVTACGSKNPQVTTEEVYQGCTEHDIRVLIEGNLDCIYCFFLLGTLGTTGEADKKGYYQADDAFFADYAGFESFVKSIYTEDTTNTLLTEYPSKDAPIYKKDGDNILVNPKNIKSVDQYNVVWNDDYTVNLYENETDNTRCDFECITYELTDEGEKEYIARGTAIYENDLWKLEALVY